MNNKLDLDQLKDLFKTIFEGFHKDGYFTEKIGPYNNEYDCYGELGDDEAIRSLLFLKLRKKSLWSIYSHVSQYNEDDLFDMIEFCYDIISKPIYQTNNNFLGYHKAEGQEEYRQKMNVQLKDYDDGYKIDKHGNIVRVVQNELSQLIEKEPPTEDEDVKQKIEQAVNNYRKRNSTILDRKESVRHLADILEKLRPKIKGKIPHKDESDLFNIINNYGIRHSNDKQKNDYDGNIWTSWMFHFYLATVHACLKLIEREGSS
ncbi:MAG: hypothetical protein FWB91_13305 [Defluviitaleaceae bacterium]|nr:hypothetical protein [Defluviitaleaceae bacterium]